MGIYPLDGDSGPAARRPDHLDGSVQDVSLSASKQKRLNDGNFVGHQTHC